MNESVATQARGQIKDLLSNIRISWGGFFAALLLRPARLAQISSGLFQILAVFTIGLALAIGLQWFSVGLDNPGALRLRINPKAIEGEALYALALLLTSAVAAAFAKTKSNASQSKSGYVTLLAPSSTLIYVLLAAASLLVSIAFEILSHSTRDPVLASLLQYGVLFWFYFFAVVNLTRGLNLKAAQAFICLIPMWLMLAYGMRYPPEPFWYPVNAQAASVNPASENVLEEQTKVFAKQLAAIAPQRPGIRDVYFLGFAPYATEDVFKFELDTITPLIEERFNAKGRTIRLSNHLQTLNQFGFASVANLRRALLNIASKMDLSEDVLVLYLTSHGSRKHELVSDMPPLQFNEVSPAILRSLLDEAGIRYRVVIVSACFSGGFIAPLQSSETLVMTASAKDRTSFGCGSESNFTYFGKAVIDEQLRKTRSFEQAFKNAIPLLKEREAKMNHPFSDPQISVGASIRPVLKELEDQLNAR